MTVAQQVKSQFNPVQWAAVVLPLLVALIGAWSSISTRLSLTEQRQEEYILPSVQATAGRLNALEAINGRREEQIDNLQKQNAALIAEIRQLGEEIRRARMNR